MSKKPLDDVNNLYYPELTGCTDGGCIFVDNSKNMHTNGGCSCERELRRLPQGFNAARTIRFLRSELRKTASMQAENARLREDAKRWHWMRENFYWFPILDDEGMKWSAQEMDELVDTALTGKEQSDD